MKESVKMYTGDGSTLVTPKLEDKFWPIQYDPALQLFVTKDIAGLVHTIGGGGGTVKLLKRVLTVAEILALGSTPIELIPAPGANKFIQLLFGSTFTDFNSVAYNTGAMIVKFNNLEDIWSDSDAFIQSSSVLHTFKQPNINEGFPQLIDSPITISSDAPVSNGDSEITFLASYYIQDI